MSELVGNFMISNISGSAVPDGTMNNPYPVWQGYQGAGYYYFPALAQPNEVSIPIVNTAQFALLQNITAANASQYQ